MKVRISSMAFPQKRGFNSNINFLDSRIRGCDRYNFSVVAILFLFLFSSKNFAQTDWERWGKAEISYQIKVDKHEEETKVDNPGIIAGALSIVRKAYAFFISDLDGDNCPFYPSCSNFYVQSVKESGIIKGTLMFADRFTRDMNILKTASHYPRHTSGRFYDPPQNYTLNEDKIIYYPSETTVKK